MKAINIYIYIYICSSCPLKPAFLGFSPCKSIVECTRFSKETCGCSLKYWSCCPTSYPNPLSLVNLVKLFRNQLAKQTGIWLCNVCQPSPTAVLSGQGEMPLACKLASALLCAALFDAKSQSGEVPFKQPGGFSPGSAKTAKMSLMQAGSKINQSSSLRCSPQAWGEGVL